MKRSAQKTEEYIIDDLHEGVRELGELTTTDAGTRLGDKAVSAIRRLERAIPTLRQRVSGWKENFNGRARDAGEQITQYAKDKPWQVVGIAAAIGLVVGLLLSGDEPRKD